MGQDIAVPGTPEGGAGKYDVGYANKSGVGGYNLTFNPSDAIKFQLRIQHGTGPDVDGHAVNQIGIRPWLKLSFAGIHILAAYESLSESAQQSGVKVDSDKSGFGLQLSGDVGKVKFRGQLHFR